MPRLQSFRESDLHGRSSIPGATSIVSARRSREIRANRKSLVHRVKNGVYDPLTYYHILDALLDLQPRMLFRTTEFVPFLAETRTQLVWDATTVGRVINDIAESLTEANARKPIENTRRWNGMNYIMSDEREDRAAMENLLEDLAELCRQDILQELTGAFPKRMESPLNRCPSIMVPLGAAN